MAEEIPKPDFHVLVIGAGSAGLLIAQRLKTLNIPFTVYERDTSLAQRLSRDWNFGIYWAQSPLSECLPHAISSKLQSASVDPRKEPSEGDSLPILNGQTGELLTKMPAPWQRRYSRSKFRELVGEGIDIQFKKRLNDITTTDQSVTAHFTDDTSATGSLLIGADGARSLVRKYLLGEEKSALQSLPLMGIGAISTLPGSLSREMREGVLGGEITGCNFCPVGMCAYVSLHEVPDPETPETWRWMFRLTLNDKGSNLSMDAEETRKLWEENSSILAEPFRAAFLAVPERAPLWADRVCHWPTVAWNDRGGRVTLAGDSAHPMTYHRGQGLNNAVHDAAYICRAIQAHVGDGKPLQDTLSEYEKEVVERGREAVESSGRNSLMVHDWETLMGAPMFKIGARRI